MRDREKVFIEELTQSKTSFGIGDDGVVLGDFVVANDAFFEGIHFKREWGSLDRIFRKAFLVNLSDIYAMNAIPQFALLTLCLPRHFKEVTRLAQIIGECAKKHKIQIIGGDTLVGEKLHFSLTILGQRGHKTLLRKGIKSSTET